jgi:ankyrin repeat protein
MSNANKALRVAVFRRNLAATRAALNNGASPNYMYDGDPILLMAAERGNLNIVKELLNRGAHVNARRRPSGFTSLHKAMLFNRPNVVRELLARGANPKLRLFTPIRNNRNRPFQPNALWYGLGTGAYGRPKRSANTLVAEVYGRRMLKPVRARHAENLLAALFHKTVLPEPLVRYIARIGGLKKKVNGPRTLGRTNWSGWTRQNNPS